LTHSRALAIAHVMRLLYVLVGRCPLPKQHHVRDRQSTRVRERQQRTGTAHRLKTLRGAAMEREPRRAMTPDDFDAGPVDATRMSCTERLHRCLLGCEPRRER